MADVEREQASLKNDTKPIVDLYKAGSILGKFLVIAGGFIVGAATVWAAISGWISSHWK